MNIRLALLAAILVPNVALSQELERHPTTGTVYSLQEKAYLDFVCRLGEDDRLNCDFVQTNVTQAPDLEQTRKTNEEMVRAFNAGEDPFNAEQCASLQDARSGLSSPEMQSKGPEAFEMAEQLVEIFEEICATQTIESIQRLVDLTEFVEERTCRVRSQTFEQTFKETSPGNWLNVAEPYGECGVVRLDRFQRVQPFPGSALAFWNYYSEKRITTPEQMLNGMIECSGLDETLYEYVWQSQSHIMDCRYIEFGWF